MNKAKMKDPEDLSSERRQPQSRQTIPRGPLAAINAVLRRPEESLRRLTESGSGGFASSAICGAFGGFLLYGLVAGLFQGGGNCWSAG